MAGFNFILFHAGIFWFCRDFAGQLIHEGKRSNLIIEPNASTIFLDDRSRTIKNDLKNTFQDLRNKGVDLVVVVIGSFNKQIYGMLWSNKLLVTSTMQYNCLYCIMQF